MSHILNTMRVPCLTLDQRTLLEATKNNLSNFAKARKLKRCAKQTLCLDACSSQTRARCFQSICPPLADWLVESIVISYWFSLCICLLLVFQVDATLSCRFSSLAFLKVYAFLSTKMKQNCFDHNSVFVLFSLVHTNSLSFESAYFLVHFRVRKR